MIQNKKFHCEIFALVTQIKPLTVFMHKEGIAVLKKGNICDD